MAARRIKSSRSHLKMRQLKFLVHLDDERLLARAAMAAGLTQPGASKLLRDIEISFDVKLFERLARGVAPTCYGEILVRHARVALSELGLAYDEITALKSGLSGKTAIGTVVDPGTSLVPIAVARMKERHPGVLINIELDPSRPLVQRLLEGRLDMVVGRVLDSHGADNLVYEPLATDEPHAVIASTRHPLAGRKEVKLEELVDQPWILPPVGSLVRDKLMSVFMQRKLPQPTNIVETSELPVITAILQHSKMIALVPEEAAKPSCKAGLLTILSRNLPLDVGPFGIITRRNCQLSPGAQLMLNTLHEVAVEVYPQSQGRARLQA